MEDISSKKFTVKCIRIQVITPRRDKNILRRNIEENIYTLNQIRHIKETGKKIIRLPTKNPTPDQIGDIFKCYIKTECYGSIFANYEKIARSTTL